MDPLILILLILLHFFLWFPLILLTGAVLGSWRGGLAILVFLAEGTVALQFLVPGGLRVLVAINGGVEVFGGYILSWPVAAYLTGLIYERCSNRRFRTSFLAMLPGSALSFVLTVSWLLVVVAILQGIAINLWSLLLAVVVGLVSTVVPSLFAAIVLTNLWKMPHLRQHTIMP